LKIDFAEAKWRQAECFCRGGWAWGKGSCPRRAIHSVAGIKHPTVQLRGGNFATEPMPPKTIIIE